MCVCAGVLWEEAVQGWHDGYTESPGPWSPFMSLPSLVLGFTLRVSLQSSIAAGSPAIVSVLQAGRLGVPSSSFSPFEGTFLEILPNNFCLFFKGVFLETLPNNFHLYLAGYPWLQRLAGKCSPSAGPLYLIEKKSGFS